MDQITPVLPNGTVKPGEEWTKSFRQAFSFSSQPLRYTTRSKLLRHESVDGAGRFALIIRSGGLPGSSPKPIGFSGTITVELTRR